MTGDAFFYFGSEILSCTCITSYFRLFIRSTKEHYAKLSLHCKGWTIASETSMHWSESVALQDHMLMQINGLYKEQKCNHVHEQNKYWRATLKSKTANCKAEKLKRHFTLFTYCRYK